MREPLSGIDIVPPDSADCIYLQSVSMRQIFCLEQHQPFLYPGQNKSLPHFQHLHQCILQCNSKFKGDVKCDTPTLTEQDVKERFIKAYNRLAYNRDALLADCRLMQKVVSDYSDIDAKLNELYQESEVIAELTKRCIEENSLQAINQEEYLKRYNGYCERYDSIKNKIETLENEKNKRKAKEIEIGGFMYELTEYEETITEFDEQLWMMVIDKAIVHQDGSLVFVFRNGCEIEG